MAFNVKTGGRQKGTPNKSTVAFRKALEKANFFLPEEAIALYKRCTSLEDIPTQLRILEFLARYSASKPVDDSEDDPIDVTPEEEKLTEEELLTIESGSNAQSESPKTPLARRKPPLETPPRPKKVRSHPKKR